MSEDTSAGTLWFVNTDGTACEILDDTRVRHYNLSHPLWAGSRCVDCDCPTLGHNPVTGVALTYGALPSNAPVAPWYDAASVASGEFYGFLVDTIDGLDYSNYNRSHNQRALDGTNLTPMRASGRELTFTVIGSAVTERGMRYGLDWLAANLLSLGGRCDVGRILMRTFCDRTDADDLAFDPLAGVVELRDVACLIAPTWTSNYLAEHGCLVRQARFTLVATDPCLYGETTYCPVDGGGLPTVYSANLSYTAIAPDCVGGSDAETVRPFICGPLPLSLMLDRGCVNKSWMPWCEFLPGLPIESQAVTVVIEVPVGSTGAGPFSVVTFAGATDAACAAVFGDTDLHYGSVHVGAIYSGEAVMVDGVSGALFFRATPSSDWVADDSLLILSDGLPVYPRRAGCDSLYVAIRPFRSCVLEGDFEVSFSSTRITGCTTALNGASVCSGCP